MDPFACALIDALGGTRAVSRWMEAPPTTVSNMRSRLTSSRLNHLRRIANDEMPDLDVGALARQFGVELPPIGCARPLSAGKAAQVSAECVA